MDREQILAKVSSLKSIPIAIQALWDGDSAGWYVWLSAITDDNQLLQLGSISEGGDIRLFNGQVPPWPEAAAAQQLGNELVETYGIEFFFPSPEHPEDDCPDWRDRNKGYPCRRCGILLLQRSDCLWYGLCYYCHLKEEREQREAKWTAEERAGPRCHICGNPAKKELDARQVCADCFDKYEVYSCANCDGVTLLVKSIGHTSLCGSCEVRKALALLTVQQRNSIRDALLKGGCKQYRQQCIS